MAKMLPSGRPQITHDEVAAILKAHGVADGFGVVGIRGYFKNTMGDPTKNDRNVYDDAIIVATPSGFMAFNANVDPSAFRKGMASLKPGRYLYQIGIHGLNRPPAKRYEAFIQAGAVTVARDGQQDETGWFGINIHKGGDGSTGSLGCQTIPPSQWPSFRLLLKEQLARHKRKVFPYILTAY